jgi:acyl-CoA hydrolase
MHSPALPNLDPDETRFVEMVFPEQANHYGTLFGGHALSLMGKAAFVAATRHARQSVVMATPTRSSFMNRSTSASWSNWWPASNASAAVR